MILFLLFISYSDAVWQWPLESSGSPTSSFGEYRGHRFHMGLDFSTGGVEGKRVRPAGEGTVFKIRATVNGFGRAVYLSHDGYITVYAHLARFGPKLEALIRENNKDPLDWFGTLEFALPVTLSDTLAWTGESGAGMPHLHFEVRDEANRPVDPLTLQFPPLPGLSKAPLLKGLRFLPLDDNSVVNGNSQPFQTIPTVKTIQARGKIGIQVQAYAQGASGNRLGLRGVRIKANEKLIAQWLPRQLDFAFNGNAGLVFDQATSGFGPTRYAYTFDDRNKYLPAIKDFQQNSVLNVTEPTRVSVELMNLDGTWRTFEYVLDPQAKPLSEGPVLSSPVQSTSLEVFPYRDRLYISAGLEGTLQAPDRMMGLAAGDSLVYTVKPHQKTSPLIWRTASGNLKREVAWLGSGENVHLEIGHWTLKGKASLPDSVVIQEPANIQLMADVLEYQSPVLSFGRPGLPARDLKVSYDLTRVKNSRNTGFYSWSHQKKKWRYLGGTENALETGLNTLAPLVVARDIQAPLILKPKRHSYFTGERVVIPVIEKGSGVDSKSVDVQSSKGPLRGIYDSDRGWIILPPGSTQGPWTVTLSDRAGNVSRSERLR